MDYAKLRSLTVREIARALVHDGFELKRQRGSHRRFIHPDGRRVTLSFHRSSETLPIGTLKSVLETQARWREEDLERLSLLK